MGDLHGLNSHSDGPIAGEIDLGSDHYLRFTSWMPDRTLNPGYADVADIPRCGAIMRHKLSDARRAKARAEHPLIEPDVWCEGSLLFDLPGMERLFKERPRWKVESWEPLTLSPSIACGCGEHGWVRSGRWESA